MGSYWPCRTSDTQIDLQELWSVGYSCDNIIPEAIQQKWKESEEFVNRLLTFKFDRKLKPTEAIGPPEVHGFADGGELGYGATIFLRWKLKDGSHQRVPMIVKPFIALLKQGIYNTCQGIQSDVS